MNIVQVVGGLGSGKTSIVCRMLEDQPGAASVMPLAYYLRNQQFGDRDDFLLRPESVDWPLVVAHLELLASGTRVTMPGYDWQKGIRLASRLPVPPEQVLEPRPWLFIVGLFYVPGVQSFRVFVDAPASVRRQRVAARDTKIAQSLNGLYERITEPAYKQYILPQRERADEVLDGRRSPEKLAGRLRKRLAARWPEWQMG